MTLTPTDKGSLFAGVGLWSLLWGSVSKIDTIPIVQRFISRDAIFGWVRRNKSTTLLCTEAVNFGVHGVSNPTGVIFALGGTVVNAVVIFLILPFTAHEQERKLRQTLLKGA